MLSIAKLQNLKAIHNWLGQSLQLSAVVINRKTTKFESNSQRHAHIPNLTKSYYQSQNYKIWKQFTTLSHVLPCYRMLLSIAKLQNLKAIHNHHLCQCASRQVVINRKTTKFESNSQRFPFASFFNKRCYQSQNYKIWKQFTTKLIFIRFS